VDSLYPHSVVCGFTESTFSHVDSLHPLYPLNPLYPHSVTPVLKSLFDIFIDV
jgi:hypothetical protein